MANRWLGRGEPALDHRTNPVSSESYVNTCYGYSEFDGQPLRGRVRSRPVSNGSGLVLLLDFDGTVSLGDGPVLAYAQRAFADLPADRRVTAQDRLEAFLAGDPDLVRRYADGYGCVRDQVIDQVSAEQLSAAYLDSRRRLATEDLGTYPADGIAELLTELDGVATRVVLTNSPAVGVVESLQRFGLSGLLDEVIVGAHKPHRMAEHLDALTAGRRPEMLISVGDHWANDLAVPLERGCATALVSRHPRTDEPAHLHGRDLADLAPGILDWAQDPAGFIELHRPIALPA